MLTIPNSIKSLYQTDGVRKNFRVHFPNGEFSDITNDNVVQESLKFTESLCSQSTFKFGLAEASVLEFETVGVGNMYGMTIEASIEIDTSSLSAADITAIQADEGDGTLVLVGASDIGFGFYRIPLGVFRVQSCPRDHQSMAHRQVTAYSLGGGVYFASPFEDAKLKSGAPQNTLYIPNIHRLGYASMGWNSPTALSGFTKTVYDAWENFPTATASLSIFVGANSSYRYEMQATVTYKRLQFGSVIDADKLYSLEIAAQHYDSVINMIKNYIENTLGMSSSIALPALERYLIIGGTTSTMAGASTYKTKGSISVFYPKYACDYYINIPISIFIQINRIPIPSGSPIVVVFSNNFTDLVDSPVLYQYNDGMTDLRVAFESTGTNITGQATFINSYNINELLPSYFEIIAEFGKSNRMGGIETFRLDDSAPISLLPENYSEMWWDEYDFEPIGTVTVNYKDANNAEQISEISVGDGASRYDMTSNELLKNLYNATLSNVTSIITADFKPYIGTVEFTPMELTMQGWPWLEAGDALEITAEDGVVVDTYALRVEMSGIQHLQMSITAEGGEIIEGVS